MVALLLTGQKAPFVFDPSLQRRRDAAAHDESGAAEKTLSCRGVSRQIGRAHV